MEVTLVDESVANEHGWNSGCDQQAQHGGHRPGGPVGEEDPDEHVDGDEDRDHQAGLLAAALGQGAGRVAGPAAAASGSAAASAPPCARRARPRPLGLRLASPPRARARPGAAARSLLMTLLAKRRYPVARAATAPASPDFSGWNWVAISGPFSTAATNRSPPVLGPGHQRRLGAAVGLELPAAYAVGVDEVEALVLEPPRTVRVPSGARRCSTPCGVQREPGAARRPRATRRTPRSRRRARRRARTAPACRRRCRARGRPARRRPMIRGP